MSGFPNLPDIRELRQALFELDSAQHASTSALRQKTQAEKDLESSGKHQRECLQRIKKLMQAMDVESPGNFGYENRLLALLRGLASLPQDEP